VQSIVGTWKLVAVAARDRNGNKVPAPYGGKPMGRVVFNAEGRMMAVTCDGRPDLPPGSSREYSSYIGAYMFDGSLLVTRVDGASDPSRIGSDQVRGVRFEGERMVLSPPPRQTDSGEQFRELTWERIAVDNQSDRS
jgi:Lipocalin-like domain